MHLSLFPSWRVAVSVIAVILISFHPIPSAGQLTLSDEESSPVLSIDPVSQGADASFCGDVQFSNCSRDRTFLASQARTAVNGLINEAKTTESAGQGENLPILTPYVGINYIIALEGVYPSRSKRATREVQSFDPFIGEIMMFAGNFAPDNWAFCHGQLLSISDNSALFSILGTTYGGNGRTTFALPDLRGRVPKAFGSGPGLTPVRLGQKTGAESVSLTNAKMPAHTHGVPSSVVNPL
eukprot:TRINITY_DN355_c0_g2_i1.p1 TRINITY_DN355_c0_g2~~TRINITY_DN355_c0_g2_i1.p1  ORF type:complete len:239 (+),score=23.89 TRINITY_DN355_c0_g2_i1:71-787(+)